MPERTKGMRHGPRGSRLILALLAGIALVALYFALDFPVDKAESAEASHKLWQYQIEQDAFSRYDTDHDHTYSRKDVDWATDLIFAHGATINSVKYRLAHIPIGSELAELYDFDIGRVRIFGKDYGPSAAFMPVNGGYGRWWDEDAGKKTGETGCQSAKKPSQYHYRIYAPNRPIDHFFNQRWGAFVVGETHQDHNECRFKILGQEFPGIKGTEKEYFHGDPTWFGKNEIPEYFIGLLSEAAFPESKVDRVGINLYNKEHWRAGDANHVWWNNGRATFISIHPGSG